MAPRSVSRTRGKARAPTPSAEVDASSGGSNKATLAQRRRLNRLVLLLSFAIQLALLAYAAHVDANPVGGLKYTDVDWRVVYDGVVSTAHPADVAARAEGPVARWLAERGWVLGSPYARATFRYTPLLVILLSPALIAQVLGRLVLVVLTLVLPALLLADPSVPFWTTHALWTLNPVVLNITTRGSPEAVACVLVSALAVCLRRAGLGNGSRAADPARWEAAAAALLAIAASYKIFPAIYVPTIWAALASRHGWLGAAVWRFGIIAAVTALAVNLPLWLLWGQPFLEHTFLYHLSRLDHRHNFSPYFLPIYLNLAGEGGGDISNLSPAAQLALAVLRHPLSSFLPQISLALASGAALQRIPSLGLEGAMFFQTALFVVFNKVCTSQYFLWPLPLVPFLRLPRLSWAALGAALAAWVAAQALWLGTAYRLEFLALHVYLPLWGAGLLLFAVSVAGIGVLLDAAVE
jgi:phosphatidylinositol glycan class M